MFYDHPRGYYTSGFLTFQNLIQAYVSNQTELSVAAGTVGEPFPSPEYQMNRFYERVGATMPVDECGVCVHYHERSCCRCPDSHLPHGSHPRFCLPGDSSCA